MNLKLWAIAIFLTQASGSQVFAQTATAFEKEDFKQAAEFFRGEQSLVDLTLSPSGEAKIKQFNKTMLNKQVPLKVGGEAHLLKFRQPIRGNRLEAGPFSHAEALRIVQDVNQK